MRYPHGGDAASPLAGLDAVSPWAALEDADGPRWIAHRGGSLLAPENSLEAMRLADQLAADAIEMDVYKVADGALFVMHDTTADRTTNLTGTPATAFTAATALRGRIDAGSWFANTWPSDLRIPLFSDVLAGVGNRIPMIVHCNNTGSGAVAVAEIQRQELDDAVLVMGWYESELTAARAAGIPTCLLAQTGDPPAGRTWAAILADGTAYVGVDYAQATNAKIQAAHAAGLNVLVYTVNSRSAYGALPTDGSVWGVISDDPWYVKGTAALRTTGLFGAGTFFHGMAAPADLHDYRGFFTVGAPSWWGLDASGTAQADISANGGFASVRHGYLGPLPSTFTLEFDYVLDVVDYASASLQVMLGVGDKPYDDNGGGAANPNGYNVLVRANGTIDAYSVTGGTPATIGTVSTAAIAAGTTQHLRIQVTSTQLVVTRTNIATPNTLTVTNAAYRGGMYPNFGVRDVKGRWANVTVS